MRRSLTVLFILAITSGVRAQWTPVTSGVGGTIESIDFAGNVGLFCQSGTMRRTTDGGATWTTVGPTVGFRDVDMADATTAYSAGVVSSSMWISTTGGANWVQITPPTSNSLWGVSAPSPGRAFFCGTGNVVWRTNNFAASITVVNVPGASTTTLSDIHFVSDNVGCVVGQNGKVWKTSNGGTNWNEVGSFTGALWQAIHFPSAQRGFAAGSGGRVARSTDGGDSWQLLTTGSTSYLRSVHFADDLHGIVVGFDGSVLYTANGGDSWSAVAPFTAEHLHAVYMFGPASAVVAGEGGVMFRNNAIAVGMRDHASMDRTLQAWPNPVNATLNIQLPFEAIAMGAIMVFDAGGRTITVPQQIGPGTQVQLSFEALDAGLYHVVVAAGDRHYRSTVVKAH